MNFKFSNLLGAPYRGGNLLVHDNELLTPVGNRVGLVGLARAPCRRSGRHAGERAGRTSEGAASTSACSSPPASWHRPRKQPARAGARGLRVACR